MRPLDESYGGLNPNRAQSLAKKISYLISSGLSYLFKSVPIPESFPKVDSKEFSLVTLDNSIVLDAILISITRRLGCRLAESEGIDIRGRQNKVIYRVPFRSESVLEAISAQDPMHNFITFNVVYGLGPIKTTRNYSINFFDSLSLILWRSSLSVLCGEPRHVTYTKNNISRAFSRALKVDFYHHLKVIRGTPFQPIKSQADSVLSGSDFSEECERLAKDQGTSVEKIKSQCRKSFYEMSANPVRWVHFLLGKLSKLVIWHLFPIVRVSGLQNLIASSRQNPTVLVPVHRSHLDYILLGSILFKSRLNTPLVAAGINLNFWPVGFFLRRVGAFFVKRTGGADPIHGLVLKRYVTYLLKRGHLLEFFIEGGRSRTGRMRPPKLGLLKAIVAAYQKGLRKDVAFIPVSISYEHVIEDKALAQENLGGKKVEENVKSLISARGILQKKYGEVIVNFHDPIYISKFESPSEKNRSNLVSSLASELTHRMRTGTNPTLTALACTSIILSPNYAQSDRELQTYISFLSRLIDIQRSHYPMIGENSKTLQEVTTDPNLGIISRISSGLVESTECFGERIFRIPENKRLRADFYKNGTIHLFIPFALIELAKLEDGMLDWTVIQKLHAILEDDFILEPYEEFLSKIRGLQPQLESISHEFKISHGMLPLLLSPLELYFWVLNYLNRRRSEWSEASPPRLPYDSLISEIVTSSAVALQSGIINRTESISKAGIESTLEALAARGIISAPPARRGPRFVRIVSDPTDEIRFINSIIEKIVAHNNTISTNRRLSLIALK